MMMDNLPSHASACLLKDYRLIANSDNSLFYD